MFEGALSETLACVLRCPVVGMLLMMRRMTSFKRFLSVIENLVMHFLIYFKPVIRFDNRSDVMKIWSSSDVTGSIIENKLKTIDLCS